MSVYITVAIDGSPVIFLCYILSFLRHFSDVFLIKNFALKPLVCVFKSHPLVKHHANSRHRGNMWLIRDTSVIHFVIPKVFFRYFLDKNHASSLLVHFFGTQYSLIHPVYSLKRATLLLTRKHPPTHPYYPYDNFQVFPCQQFIML